LTLRDKDKRACWKKPWGSHRKGGTGVEKKYSYDSSEKKKGNRNNSERAGQGKLTGNPDPKGRHLVRGKKKKG